MRQAIRARHYSHRTEQAYVFWITRYVRFHGKRHPAEMAEPEVNQFLRHLAVHGRVAASTQNQALAALLFLYTKVLNRSLGQLEGVVRARRPRRLPVVLTRQEVRAVLDELNGTPRLVCTLLYGSGVRLLECLRLRVKDVDFPSQEIRVREGKGRKDRVTMLPSGVREPLQAPGQSPPAARRDLDRGLGRARYRMRSPESTRPPTANGPGSGCSRPRRTTWTVARGCGTDIISMSPSSSGR
ncbi:MAG: phage integrase N-terminal SAM-like domain-containing protein [bacterium]